MGGHKDRLALFQMIDGLFLEGIELERILEASEKFVESVKKTIHCVPFLELAA
jgi:hypothetical protein